MILRWEKEKHLEKDLGKDGVKAMDLMSGSTVFVATVLLVECVSQSI